MDMEWSEESILNLVESYKLFKNLWDPKDKDYFKKEKKVDAWNEIASAVGKSTEAIKKKISSLLATYRKEKNKAKSSMGTGKGTDEVYISRWFAYEAFRFLEDRDRPRQGLNTEQMVDIEEQIEGGNSQQEENGDQIQNAQESNDARSQSSTVQMPPKRVKKQAELQQSIIADAIGLMKTAASKLKTPFPDTPEEVKSFGNYIVSKMKSYPEQTRKGVEHAIFDILIKADKGYYENSIPSISTAPPPHHNMHEMFPRQAQNFFNYSQPYMSDETQQPQDSSMTYLQPPKWHQNVSKVYDQNYSTGTSPQGSICSSSSPSPQSPEFVHQQSPDSLLTLSQSHPYNRNNSTVHNSLTSSNQHSQYSNNVPSTQLAHLSNDSNASV